MAVVGPPRSGKTQFIKTTIGHIPTNINITETIQGFIKGDDKEVEKLVNEAKKKKFHEVIKIIANFFRKPQKTENENAFQFWIPEDEIKLGVGSFEWMSDKGKVIKYHPPGLLLKVKDIEEYKRQIHLYKEALETLGIKDKTIATGSIFEVMTGLFTQMADDIASLMSNMVKFLGNAIFAIIPLIIIINLLAKEEKNASTALLKLIQLWKQLDEEKKKILAARIAYEIGLNTEKGRELVYDTLENLSGNNYQKLKTTLDNIESQIEQIKLEVDKLREELLKEIEARITEGTRELKNVNEIARYLRIPNDRIGKIVITSEVDRVANEVLGSVNEGVCVITGDAGSGKSTLLYMVSKKLIESGKRVFIVEDLQAFKPLEFVELDNAYAILDVTDLEKARGLRERLGRIGDLSLLRRFIIAIRSSYIDEVLMRYFKIFHVVELRYGKDTLMEIALRELKSSFTQLSEVDLVKYSSLLVDKSEGLPIYVVEAVKYAREVGDVKAINGVPKGIRSLILSILSSEVEEFGGGVFLLYYLVSHYPLIPVEYFRDIVSLLQVRGMPRYLEVSGSRLSLHSWYRVVIDDIIVSKGFRGYGSVDNLVYRIRDSLSEFIPLLVNNHIINYYFEKIYSLLVSRSTVPSELKRELEEFYDGFKGGFVRVEDVIDLLILVSLLRFVKSRLHKSSGDTFDMLKESVNYNILSADDLDLYYQMLSFFANSYLSKEAVNEAIFSNRPLYYVTLFFLSRLFKNEFMDNVAKYFIEGDDKIDMSLERISYFYRLFTGEHITCNIYISSLVTVLEKLGYLRLENEADRSMLYYLKGNYEKALEEINKAISLNPNNHKYYKIKGDILYKLKRYEEAVKEYDKAISLNPNNPKYHNNKADLLNRLGHYEEALNEVNIAISLDPNNPKYHSTKGVALAHLGRCSEAFEEINIAMKLAKENSIPQKDLDEIQKDFNEVQTICTKIKG